MFTKNGFTVPSPGTDLPAWFLSGLNSIDREFIVIYHPYEVIYDPIVNEYEGEVENPRFKIHREGGYQLLGWPLRLNKDELKPEEKWHIWHYVWPHGYSHVVPIESTEPEYLKLLATRLKAQFDFNNKYDPRAYQRHLVQMEEEQKEVAQAAQQDLFDAVQEENAWLMKKAMENFDRGIVKPTNPQKEQIISFPGQTNKSKTSRGLTDEEGGLIIPESW